MGHLDAFQASALILAKIGEQSFAGHLDAHHVLKALSQERIRKVKGSTSRKGNLDDKIACIRRKALSISPLTCPQAMRRYRFAYRRNTGPFLDR